MPAKKKEFCKNGHRRIPENLHQRKCKICQNIRQIERRKSKPEFFLWQAAKDRAIKSGIDFSIEVSDILIPEVCPVLGISILPANGKRSANSPSLDRKDNALGYIKGNICVISWRANRLKSDATIEELTAVVNWMQKG